MVTISNCSSVSKYTVWLMVAGGMIKEQGMFLLSTLRYEKFCANIYDTYCFFYMALLS